MADDLIITFGSDLSKVRTDLDALRASMSANPIPLFGGGSVPGAPVGATVAGVGGINTVPAIASINLAAASLASAMNAAAASIASVAGSVAVAGGIAPAAAAGGLNPANDGWWNALNSLEPGNAGGDPGQGGGSGGGRRGRGGSSLVNYLALAGRRFAPAAVGAYVASSAKTMEAEQRSHFAINSAGSYEEYNAAQLARVNAVTGTLLGSTAENFSGMFGLRRSEQQEIRERIEGNTKDQAAYQGNRQAYVNSSGFGRTTAAFAAGGNYAMDLEKIQVDLAAKRSELTSGSGGIDQLENLRDTAQRQVTALRRKDLNDKEAAVTAQSVTRYNTLIDTQRTGLATAEGQAGFATRLAKFQRGVALDALDNQVAAAGDIAVDGLSERSAAQRQLDRQYISQRESAVNDPEQQRRLRGVYLANTRAAARANERSDNYSIMADQGQTTSFNRTAANDPFGGRVASLRTQNAIETKQAIEEGRKPEALAAMEVRQSAQANAMVASQVRSSYIALMGGSYQQAAMGLQLGRDQLGAQLAGIQGQTEGEMAASASLPTGGPFGAFSAIKQFTQGGIRSRGAQQAALANQSATDRHAALDFNIESMRIRTSLDGRPEDRELRAQTNTILRNSQVAALVANKQDEAGEYEKGRLQLKGLRQGYTDNFKASEISDIGRAGGSDDVKALSDIAKAMKALERVPTKDELQKIINDAVKQIDQTR